MKRRIITSLFLAFAFIAKAQTEAPGWIQNVRLSGYGVVQYTASTQKNATNNSFNLRYGRVALDGRFLNDFAWKIQMQINGNVSSLGSSPRVVDIFAEWQKYDFAKIKIGQFKRPFTFENPMHPIDQGFMSYAQIVSNLAGMNDRTGEHPSNGRDIGIQLQGDLLKTSSGRHLLHYQVGVFNGEGINMRDADQQKDIIGGLWVIPVAGLRLGVFGWTGSTTRKATYTETITTPMGPVQQTVNRSVTLQKRRYALSAEYAKNDWTFRTEYVHSTGEAFQSRNPDGKSAASLALSTHGDRAEGVYAAVIAPIIKKKLHVKARYDFYTPSNSWNDARTLYEVGVDYEFAKHLKLSGEYVFVNDKLLAKPNYNIADIQISFRF